MNTLGQCGARFYLTGGTALSRAYYHHRYSDDLDFFVNDDDEYTAQVKEVLTKLKEDGFIWETEQDFVSSEYFTTLKVRSDKSDTFLKLDFINDVSAHFGGFSDTPIFNKTDSVRNILANKLTAIFRFAAKDVADIREIALHENVNWSEAIQDARQKDAGVELYYVSRILAGIPRDEYEKINWIKDPGWESFKEDIDKIAFDMLNG